MTSLNLSPRERAIARMIVSEGLDNAKIAEQLGTSLGATKNSVRSVLDKTGMGTRVELAMYGRSNLAFLTHIFEIQ